MHPISQLNTFISVLAPGPLVHNSAARTGIPKSFLHAVPCNISLKVLVSALASQLVTEFAPRKPQVPKVGDTDLSKPHTSPDD